MFSFIFLLAAIFKHGNIVFKEINDPFHSGLSTRFLAGFIGILIHAIGANAFIIVRIINPFWFLLTMVVVIPELVTKYASDEIA